jgi:hypothetical protein
VKSTEKRGGPGRGQGRKPIQQGAETVPVTLRMTTAQRDKLRALGGGKWLRGEIEKAVV